MADQRAELLARLEEFEAPAGALRYARGFASFDDAWDSPSPAHLRLWLAAVVGLPVEAVAEAVAAAFFAAAEDEPAVERVARCVELSVAAGDAATCAEQAERCERESRSGAPYRDSPKLAALARLAAQICRAFESLRSADLLMESIRMNRARSTAGYLGGGVQAFLPADPGPATLLASPPQSAERGLLIMAIALASESTAELRELFTDPTPIDELVWETLAPE